jgi:hypothetical protein
MSRAPPGRRWPVRRTSAFSRAQVQSPASSKARGPRPDGSALCACCCKSKARRASKQQDGHHTRAALGRRASTRLVLRLASRAMALLICSFGSIGRGRQPLFCFAEEFAGIWDTAGPFRLCIARIFPHWSPPGSGEKQHCADQPRPPSSPLPLPLEVGPKEASRFRPIASRFTKLNFSEPFLGGDEVNLQRSPSHPATISTEITAVQILLAEGLPFIR